MNLGRKLLKYMPFHKFMLATTLLLILSSVLAACGDSATPTPAATTTAATTTAAATTTTVAAATTAATTTTVATTTAATTTAATTTASTTATTVNSDTSSTTPAVTGGTSGVAKIGQELVGQLLAVDAGASSKPYSFNVRVSGIENFTVITANNQPKKPSGIFLVVLYDIANVGLNSGNAADYITIQDKDGQKFKPSTDFDLIGALNDLDNKKYPYYEDIQPSSIGHDFQVFDVPANDSGFKLTIQEGETASTRTPSTKSFATPEPASGGSTDTTKLGQELVGQSLSADSSSEGIKSDVKVAGVEAQTQLKGKDKTVKAKGVYLILDLKVASFGQYPTDAPDLTFQVQDGKGRNFDALISSDVELALQDIDPDKYQLDSFEDVNPGFIRDRYVIFDVPTDATKLKLLVTDSYENTRKVSADDLKTSGGSGADSGAGQELVGKTITSKKGLTFTINKVKRYSQLMAGSQLFDKTDGVFLIVGYDLKNGSSDSVNVDELNLVLTDDQSRNYGSVYYITDASPDYEKEFPTSTEDIKAGDSGKGYLIFEIPKDAKSFTLRATSTE